MTQATVDRAALKSALGVLSRVANPKSRIPVLTQVRLRVNGDVQLAATDLEVSAVVTLPRQGRSKRGEFQALLPAQRLADYVKTSKAETVTFEREDAFKTKLDDAAALVGLGIEDFPTTLGEEGTLLASFNAAEFAQAIHLTKFAASAEVVRYALTGLLIEVKKGKAAIVASDGKRLSAVRLAAKTERDFKVIIPFKAAELLERIADQADPIYRVGVRATLVKATDGVSGRQSDTETIQQLHFVIGETGLYTRIVEGHFPDWEAVTPDHKEHVVTVDRKALIAEIDRVRQACTDKTLATKFTFGGGKVVLFSKTQDVGEARAELPVDGQGELSIVFNPLYVLDFLKAQPKSVERVTLRFRDKNAARLFQGVKGNEYVLMPLTVTL
jgi:DNA polymerase III subunit beta